MQLFATRLKPRETKPPLLARKEFEPFKDLVEGRIFPQLKQEARVTVNRNCSSESRSCPAIKLSKANDALHPVNLFLVKLYTLSLFSAFAGLAAQKLGATDTAGALTFLGTLSVSVVGLVKHTAWRLKQFVEGLQELRQQGRL